MLAERLSMFNDCLDVFQNSLELGFSVDGAALVYRNLFLHPPLISCIPIFRSCLYIGKLLLAYSEDIISARSWNIYSFSW